MSRLLSSFSKIDRIRFTLERTISAEFPQLNVWMMNHMIKLPSSDRALLIATPFRRAIGFECYHVGSCPNRRARIGFMFNEVSYYGYDHWLTFDGVSNKRHAGGLRYEGVPEKVVVDALMERFRRCGIAYLTDGTGAHSVCDSCKYQLTCLGKEDSR